MKRAATCAALLAAASAWAAGGHHAVDDAAILEPGQCELESWFSRAQGGQRLLHAGVGCRVGPLQLDAAGEHERQGGASQGGYQLQAKWAREVAEGFSIGASAGPGWQSHQRPRHQGTTLSALASWSPRDDVALHLNLGRDLVHRGRDSARHGVAAEWSPARDWSLVAERFLEERSHFVRAGVRRAAGRNWTLDFSRAHGLGSGGGASWTFGASRLLDGD